MNLLDYRRLLKKVLGIFALGLIVFAIGMTLVTLVLQPIIWVTNMLGRISEIEYCNDDDARKRQECKTWVEDVQRRKDDRVADNRNPWI